MNLEPFKGPGSTPKRRAFWQEVTAAVKASQKIAGRHVTVDEHPGKGTVINVADTSARRKPTPAGGDTCPPANPCSVTINALTSTGITGTRSIGPKPIGTSYSTDSDGWRSDPWFSDDTDCDCGDCGIVVTCSTQFVWDNVTPNGTGEGWSILIILNHLVGDSSLANGWYISFYLGDTTCSYNNSCIFLGTHDSIFATDLNVTATIPGTAGYCPPGSTGSIDLTFHPC